jgi:hypothetical protein
LFVRYSLHVQLHFTIVFDLQHLFKEPAFLYSLLAPELQ